MCWTIPALGHDRRQFATRFAHPRRRHNRFKLSISASSFAIESLPCRSARASYVSRLARYSALNRLALDYTQRVGACADRRLSTGPGLRGMFSHAAIDLLGPKLPERAPDSRTTVHFLGRRCLRLGDQGRVHAWWRRCYPGRRYSAFGAQQYDTGGHLSAADRSRNEYNA